MTDQNMIECRACNGHGADPLSDNVNWLPCRSCNGVGKVYRKPATPAVDTLPDPDKLVHEQPAIESSHADQRDYDNQLKSVGCQDEIDKPNKGPKVTGKDGADLFQMLADGQFHKAKNIDMESRKIRAICNVYPNQFLSTQAGYKRVRDATEAEIENAVADLRSRCHHLGRRAAALESVLVGRIDADTTNDGT